MKIHIHSDRKDMHVAASLYIAAGQIAGVHITPPNEADIVINVDSIHNKGLLRGKKTVYWELDDNLHQGKNEKFYDVDLLYIVSRARKHLYPPKTRVLPVAAEPTIHYDWGFEKEYDVVFIAELENNPSYQLRKQIWDEIKDRFHVRDGKCEPQNYPKELSKGKLLFNVNPQIGEEPPLVITRFFESMAMGCLMQNYSPELDEFAEAGIHYIPFFNGLDAVEQIGFHLRAPTRDKIAKASRQLILDKHTWAHRLKRIIDDVCSL